jgi:hypothetical protein
MLQLSRAKIDLTENNGLVGFVSSKCYPLGGLISTLCGSILQAALSQSIVVAIVRAISSGFALAEKSLSKALPVR